MNALARQRRVLFLIADTGAGHRSAANAIHHAMRQLTESPSHAPARAPVPTGPDAPRRAANIPESDAWEALIVDAFVASSRFPLRNGVFLYGPAIKHSPRLYGQFFRMTNTSSRFRAAWRLARPFWYQGLMRLFLETQPDVIVSVHPLLNHNTLQILHDLDVKVPFVTVVTDLVSVHCAWFARGVTACAVPTEAARDFAVAAGVPARRVHLLGMPIDPKFAQPPAASREALRAELGLDPHLPTVLLVGGGEGAIGLAESALALGHSNLAIQMIVVTGRNQQLFAQLQRERTGFRVPAQILGFVHNMPDLMHAADVIVTKAGPGTITEVMACGLPIILTGAVPGQEEGNLSWIVDNDLGVLARSPGAVVAALQDMLSPESGRLQQLRANVQRESRPEAAFGIARLILSYLPAVDSLSPWQRVRRGATARRYHRRSAGSVRTPSGRRQRRPTIPLNVEEPRRTRAALSGLSLRRIRRRADGRPRRIPGLANLRGARALLLKGTNLGKIQLRRPSSGRRRHDAGTAFGRSSG